MKMDTIFVMDIIITFFSLYILFSSFRMKKTGVIDKILLPADEIKKVKDKRGFIDFVFPVLVIFAGMGFVDGAVGIISDKLFEIKYWNYIELATFLAITVVLSHKIRKAKEKFCR